MVGMLVMILAEGAVGQGNGPDRLKRLAASAGEGMPESVIDSVADMPYDLLSSDLDIALDLQRRALAALRVRGAPEREGDVMFQMSTAFYLRGSADSATHYALGAIEAFRSAGASAKECHAQCALAYNMKRRDLKAAFDLMRQGVACLNRLGASEPLAADYNKLGVLHEMTGALDSARYFYTRSLELKEDIGDSLGIPFSMNCIGTVDHMLGDYQSAEEWFKRAMILRERRKDAFGVAEQMLYFGELYEAWGRTDSAIAAYEEALSRTSDLGYPRGRQQALDRLSALYERSGRLQDALSAAHAAAMIKDSLLGVERARVVLDLEQRYRVAEKDRDLRVATAVSESRRLYAWAIGIGSLLLLAIAALWFQRRQGRLRSERDAAVIAEREQGLRAVFEATENERSRLARELHDGIGQQLGGLKHRLEYIRAKHADEQLAEVLAIVDETAGEVRDLAHQMMPRALSRLGLVPALRDLMRSTFEGTGVEATFDHTEIDEHLAPEISTGLYRIAQELLSNIIRHAGASRVDMQLLRNRGMVILMVQDDGIGIGRSPDGRGIGVRSMSHRARALGGTFAIERQEPRGTAATVRIPLKKND